MLVAIDVGNTQTVVGLFAPGDGPGGSSHQLLHHWRVSTVANRTADELALQMHHLFELRDLDPGEAITGVAVASVVPRLRTALREMTDRWFKVNTVIVEPGIKTGMPILYDNPREVGADRIADAVAAYDLYGGPTIVVDFGTATTFEVVSEKGEYLGGVILPGIEISLEALFARAALLPRVELVEPRSVLAKNTVESVQSGAIYGFAAQVDGLCRRLEAELGPCTVVGTGGLAGLIGPVSEAIEHHEPWLTLYGLRIIYGRNER
ncbi:type III pantothenate kinase [Acidiferrimicrobium sp. IK]|uniref:type III pantothenate kinase n=1 Tax=Acidiferrimicrobium sp. IK TaxID=2871700 RepID=UPI0021CB1BF7|nr:type III pantothenate kinase [Acidiferrimicrobium sp. IK]MCU4186976.1 type III pantothenate kinase [Acidiferrimicrobium sp. IK]